MKIYEAIQDIKDYYSGIKADGSKIKDEESRDIVSFGNPDFQLTGVVTTCFASMDVIQDAISKKANLIICHEALFWNHGDKQAWLEDNKVYKIKRQLLEENGIVVWRNHDYIHSGMMVNGQLVDGIFAGVLAALGWENYLIGDPFRPLNFKIPRSHSKDVAKHLVESLGLEGLRMIGQSDMYIETVSICMHVMGDDNDKISFTDANDIDALIALEVIDYTLSEYVRDSYQGGLDKVIYSVGHFNLEEPGMEYMLNYLPDILGNDIPCYFSKSGDSFTYYTP